MSADVRVVEVDRDFYVKLAEYLLITERWSKDGGLVLWAMAPELGDSRQLIFKPKRKNETAS